MRIIFTCTCGNHAEIESESWFLAQKAVLMAGWTEKLETFSAYRCPKCAEAFKPVSSAAEQRTLTPQVDGSNPSPVAKDDGA